MIWQRCRGFVAPLMILLPGNNFTNWRLSPS
jgi:hypothetical protein